MTVCTRSLPGLEPAGGLVGDPLALMARASVDTEHELRTALADSGLEPQARDQFHRTALGLLQELLPEGTLPTGEQKREALAQVSAQARRLQQALQHLGRLSTETVDLLEAQVHAVAARGDAPAWLSSAVDVAETRGMSPGLTACMWHAAALASAGADAAAARVVVESRARPAEHRGRGLAELVVRAFHDQFGRLPPKDARCWFVRYAAALGKLGGLATGPRVTSAAVECLAAAVGTRRGLSKRGTKPGSPPRLVQP